MSTCTGSNRPVGSGSRCETCGTSFGFPHPANLTVGSLAPEHPAEDDITERGFYMVVVATSYPWGDASTYRYERTLDTYADAEDFIMERENVTGYMETWTILHYAPVPF